MPDLSLHEEGDAAARIEAARVEMIAAAAEAWESIRAMEPSPERVDLERSFAEQARTSLPLAPENILLAEHARTASHDEDPYFHPTLATLARLEHGSADGYTLDTGLLAILVGLAGVHRGRLNQYDDAHFQTKRELKRNRMTGRLEANGFIFGKLGPPKSDAPYVMELPDRFPMR